MLNEKGFTLIEMLIVFVILGILAAICVPQFSRNAETVQRRSDLSQEISAEMNTLSEKDQQIQNLESGDLITTKTHVNHVYVVVKSLDGEVHALLVVPGRDVMIDNENIGTVIGRNNPWHKQAILRAIVKN